jgi:hypothetical protein
MHKASKVTIVFLALLAGLVTLTTSAFAQSVDSYGHYYQPTSFSNKQEIEGKTFTAEFVARDVYQDFGGTDANPYVAGKEFKIVAHQDLAGASCTPAQSVSGSNGRFKATCSASTTGRLVLHVEPAFDGYPRSKEYEITFVDKKSATQTVDPTYPKYTVTEISTDKGPCSSGFASGSSFVSCDKGINSVVVTCRNGYTARIDFAECIGSNDIRLNEVEDSVCNAARCEKATPKPKVSSSPSASTKAVVATASTSLASASANPTLTPSANLSPVPLPASPTPQPQGTQQSSLLPVIVGCAITVLAVSLAVVGWNYWQKKKIHANF